MMSASQIAVRIDKLPSFPVSVQRVIEELQSPRSSAESVAIALELDPPLVASVLRIANSGFYGRAKVSSIQAAVTRVGLQEVRGLATSAALLDVIGSGGAQEIKDLYALALATGLAVSRVARRASSNEPSVANGAAFTAALLHDIGLFAAFSFSSGGMRRCLEHAKAKNQPLCEVERLAMGVPHTELGSMLLQRWRLGEAEIEACRWHHSLRSAPAQHRTLVALIHVAEYLVLQQVTDQLFSVLTPFLQPEALTILRLEAAQIESLAVEVKPCVEHAAEMVGELLSSSRRTKK
jgi:HD-like signal output (HDOD) protein